MSINDHKLPKRSYPPLYEKLIPILLVGLVVVMGIALLIAVGVASGLLGVAR